MIVKALTLALKGVAAAAVSGKITTDPVLIEEEEVEGLVVSYR